MRLTWESVLLVKVVVCGTMKESCDLIGQIQSMKNTHPGCSIKNAILKNFAIFTGKHLKTLHHNCFPVNIAKLLRKPIQKNICDQLFRKHLNSRLTDFISILNFSQKLRICFLTHCHSESKKAESISWHVQSTEAVSQIRSVKRSN